MQAAGIADCCKKLLYYRCFTGALHWNEYMSLTMKIAAHTILEDAENCKFEEKRLIIFLLLRCLMCYFAYIANIR